MATPTVYVICDQNCKFESMTKEQILAAIVQAVETGTIGNIDTGFVQTIKTINGHGLKFFVGEQSEYEALSEEDKEDLFAIITNDTTRENLLAVVNDLLKNMQGLQDGSVIARKANSLIVGAPKENTAKKLTEYGYYYIEIGNDIQRLAFGVVRWVGNIVAPPSITTYGNTSNPFHSFKLAVAADGSITLTEFKISSEGATTTEDITASWKIHTVKVGE